MNLNDEVYRNDMILCLALDPTYYYIGMFNQVNLSFNIANERVHHRLSVCRNY